MGGVLVDVHRERAVSGFKAIGVYNADELIDAYHHKGVFLDIEKGEINEDEFCASLSNIAGKALQKDEVYTAWRSIIDPPPLYKLDFLKSLQRNYRTFLLSNNNPILVEHWALTTEFSAYHQPVSHYFERCYFSYKLHCVKPDAEIFCRMLDDSGIEAATSLYIDDSANNIAAAEQQGFQIMLVENASDWRKPLLERLSTK
jgi:putative hydrolase of the HAD superfamily